MSKYILVTETGSDISPDMAAEYGIEIVPMHVTFDSEPLDDGAFPVERIPEYYNATGKIPKTSGSTPDDFEKKFNEIHERDPKAHILYLAYSAVTTCSYQSAVIASKDRDYVTALDTKQVSVGQCAVVAAMGEFLQAKPEITVAEAVAEAEKLIASARMCFAPSESIPLNPIDAAISPISSE